MCEISTKLHLPLLTNHVVITNKILDLLTIEKRMTGSQQNGMYCGSSLREKIGEYLHIILIFTKIFCPEENVKCTHKKSNTSS